MSKIRALLALAALGLATPAIAATLTLPSVTINSPPSTAISCTATGATQGDPGTVLFTCNVSPANWRGAVSITTGPQFVVIGISMAANTFSVAVGATALPPGTYAPGTLTSVP